MSSPLFLDMLTTRKGKYAQVIEIALVDIAGKIVFENRLKPTVLLKKMQQQFMVSVLNSC
ncbi:hypothetical protein EGD84_20895 [Salmonella enterica]|nr:hypothetical protein [Salmonella enterica]